MRELTNAERECRSNAFNKFADFDAANKGTVGEFRAFNAGFAAGLDYQQAKLNAYAAYVAGKITLRELEEVINGNAN